jgi:putative ABC transport system permease protein
MLVRFVGLFRRRQHEAEMNAELRAHLDALIERNVAAGMSSEEARYAALRTFGGIEQVREHARDQRRSATVDGIMQDVRYAARQLRKAPGFTATIVVTLALGIGSCVTIFSVVDTQLINSYTPAAERPIWFRMVRESGAVTMGASAADFVDWRSSAKSFEVLVAQSYAAAFLTGEGEPRQLQAARILPGWFRVYPTQLELGRDFLPEEMQPGKDKVAIINHGLWQSAFGGSPTVIGRTITINDEPHTVIGVTPDRYKRSGHLTEIWLPLSFTPPMLASRGNRMLNVRGRLAPGVTLAQAQAELDVIGAQLARQFPATNAGLRIEAFEGHAFSQRQRGPILWTLFGAVLALLLIACANVANLLLTRATVRQREISLRAALGATRGRIVRLLLIESALLAVIGGGAGLLLARWGLDLLRWHAGQTPAISALRYVEPDARMMGFAVIVSVATALVAGLAPAWLGSSVNLNESLKQGTRGSAGRGNRVRQALVVLEIACGLILVIGAGLLIRSAMLASRADPGYVAERVSTMALNLRATKYRNVTQTVAFTNGLLEKLRNLPGVASAGVANRLPVRSGSSYNFTRDGTAAVPPSAASAFAVTPGYFEAMRIRLLRGRFFTDRDDARNSRVVVINEALARQHFAGEDPVGQAITLAASNPPVRAEIIGVVGDVWEGELGETTKPQLYEPLEQSHRAWLGLTFVVRAAGKNGPQPATLKSEVYAVDADQPVMNVMSLDEAAIERTALPRFERHLLTVFASIALLIAAVGIYGVISFTVTQRTTEIGIRLALGAAQSDVASLVVSQGARLVALGLGAGLVGAAAGGQVIQSRLTNITAHDPATLVVAVLTFAGVGLSACLIPARRAMKVDPMVALRAE